MISTMLKNENVKLIEEIRRYRLQLLIDEYGSIAALAQKLDRQPAQVSQWKNASIDPKTNKPRHMKSDTARRIEACTGKPDGWMDQPFNNTPKTLQQERSEYLHESSLTEDESLLIAWYRSKSTEEKTHVLSLLGINKAPDFAKSA
jgi:hypothetical protein